MDEPLGALDRQLRDQMQLEIKELHSRLGITVLYVTHDQDEAMAMSDRICLMANSRIAQIGTPQELYFAPRSEFVARFLGESNILAGIGEGDGTLRVGEAGIKIRASAKPPPDEAATIVVRPERIALLAPGDAADNVASGTLKDVVFQGGVTRYFVALPGGVTLSAKMLTPLAGAPALGETVRVGWSAAHTLLLDGRGASFETPAARAPQDEGFS
jgi:putative spermidine/putrescine transport system ATP-binding protein